VVRIQSVKLLGRAGGKAAVDGDISPDDSLAVAQENKLLTLTEGIRVTPVAARNGSLTGGGAR
jgi:hypothetical protein